MDGTMSETRFTSGMLVFPNLTQLDLTGPYEVLARLPGAETLLLWKNLDSVRSEHGLTLLPMATIAGAGTTRHTRVDSPGVTGWPENARAMSSRTFEDRR